MRILLAHNSLYYPSYGGGDKSNRLLMEALAARGNTVRVVSRVEEFGPDAHERLAAELHRRNIHIDRADGPGIGIHLNGVDVRVLTKNGHWRAFFSSHVHAFDPDVILTSTDDPAQLLLDLALRATRARVVYLVRATVAAPFGPDSGMPSAAKTAALREVDGAVGVSEYVAEYTRRWAGIDAVHVPISLLPPGEAPLLGRFENRFVGMVNPCGVKGLPIFLELARRFPEQAFAAIPSWGTSEDDLIALRGMRNISLVGPFDNIDDFLRDVRVMLVPSLWAEARSRVILEAMSRGIPVLASDVGGLREAKLGVDYVLPVNPVSSYRPAVDNLMVPMAEIPEQDAGPWEIVLRRLLTDPAHYEELSTESRRAALAYARTLTAEPLEQYLRSLTGKPREKARAVQSRRGTTALTPQKHRLLALRLKSLRNSRRRWITEQEAAGLARRDIVDLANRLVAEAVPGSDIEIYWDGMWIRRVGPHHFPDHELFRCATPDWDRWMNLAREYQREADDYWFHIYKPKPGDVIIDIGAGRGEDVFAFSKAVGPSGRVWAIEPHPTSFAVLKKFAELNHLANVVPLNYGCTDQPTTLQIESLEVWESNYVRSGEATPTSHAIRGVPFDDVAREFAITAIDFLKMNIEGAERTALPGCRESLERTRHICVAAHDFRAARGEGDEFLTFDFVNDFLHRSGFETLTRDDDPRYYVPYHVHGWRAS